LTVSGFHLIENIKHTSNGKTNYSITFHGRKTKSQEKIETKTRANFGLRVWPICVKVTQTPKNI